ncbi:MAG: DUF2023 family protein [Bacteroidales bacterium]|jgi:hypothetical protein|nr:DUF2023 family protein [Bacteroidales bacterium]
MKVLAHHIYEYKKGLRNLVLHTLDASLKPLAELKLQQQNIDYIIRYVTPSKINLFFGKPECVRVIDKIGDKNLNKFTPEEDFILGTMLGYDRLQQCHRYLKKKEQENVKIEEVNNFENLKFRNPGK